MKMANRRTARRPGPMGGCYPVGPIYFTPCIPFRTDGRKILALQIYARLPKMEPHMHLSRVDLGRVFVRGDVLLMGAKYRMVWATNVLVPVVNQKFPRLRSDVRMDDLLDLAASGLHQGVWMIRTGAAHAGNAMGLPRVGQVPAAMVRAVEIAFARERAAVAIEGKYAGFV